MAQNTCRFIFFIVYLFSSLISSNYTLAYDQSSSEGSEELTVYEKEVLASAQKAVLSSIQGPNKVQLIDQGYLDLPAGYIFVPEKEGQEYINTLGNQVPGFIGLIMPQDDPLTWFITVSFLKLGYLRDDDAKNLQSENMLEVMKKNTEKVNSERIARGIAPIEITGWLEPPTYNAETHRLTWSTLGSQRISTDDFNRIVNYNTGIMPGSV